MVSKTQVRVNEPIVPIGFFVASGKGISPVSPLNAFDLALIRAGIAQCSLVNTLGLILSPGAREVQRGRIAVGSVLYAIMARMDGKEGETISAGVAWAWEKDRRYGIVATAHGHMDRKALMDILNRKVSKMSQNRGVELTGVKHRVETLRVPMKHYGSVLSTLVYGL